MSINDPNAKMGRRRKPIVSTDDDEEEREEELKGYDKAGGVRKLELLLAKYRDGVSKLKIDLDADLARMLIKEAEEAAA